MERLIIKEYYKNRVGLNMRHVQTLKDRINDFHLRKTEDHNVKVSFFKVAISNFCFRNFLCRN